MMRGKGIWNKFQGLDPCGTSDIIKSCNKIPELQWEGTIS